MPVGVRLLLLLFVAAAACRGPGNHPEAEAADLAQNPGQGWPALLVKDPVPLEPPVASGHGSAQALLDFSRGKSLLQSEPFLDRVGALGMVALSALEEAARDDDPDLRFKATLLLGGLRDPRTASPLSARLADPGEEVAMMAARALALLGEPWTGPALLETFLGTRRHPSLRVRVEAARAALRLGYPPAAEFLLLVLRENTRLAAPFGGAKDWQYQTRWAWEKWVAAEAWKEFSGLDPGFDPNQGVPQMESSLRVWIAWWESEGSKRPLPAGVRNDLRFRKVAGALMDAAEGEDRESADGSANLLRILALDQG